MTDFVSGSAENALEKAATTENAHTDALSQDAFLHRPSQHPQWAPGPFAVDPSMTFDLVGQWPDPAGIGWSSEAIFNPSVIVVDDRLHVFYRASPRKESLASRIGHAVLTEEGWRDDPLNPVIWGDLENENLGVEDPKVYRGPDGYVLFYNSIFEPTSAELSQYPSPGYLVEGVGCDISVATSPDLVTWTKHGSIVPREQSRLWAKGAVIPRNADGSAVMIGGQFLMYISEGFNGVLHVGRSTDLLHWTFEAEQYLDLEHLGGDLHEVATATALDDYFVLDFFFSDLTGWTAARARYDFDAPITPVEFAPGGTLAWGGLARWQERWIFSQGWDAAPGRRQLLFYRSVEGAADWG